MGHVSLEGNAKADELARIEPLVAIHLLWTLNLSVTWEIYVLQRGNQKRSNSIVAKRSQLRKETRGRTEVGGLSRDFDRIKFKI